MKGAMARWVWPRAISGLPTPVGPIMRMFLGVISPRSGSGTCARRQRLRSAIATARLASSCPTMFLSSSWTISCGVIIAGGALAGAAAAGGASSMGEGFIVRASKRFDHVVLVGVDADLGGDLERFLHDFRGRELRVVQQRQRRRLRVAAAAADGEEPVLGLEHVAVAGDAERSLAVGDAKHRFQAAQHPVGPPVLGELHRRAQQVPLVLLELRLEALEERE